MQMCCFSELGRSRKRLSQSALELTSQDDLLSEASLMTSATGVATAATLTVVTTSSTRSTKSLLPAFLTPPLMRKRKHLHDTNFSTSLPTSTASPTKSGGKSPKFLSYLKVSVVHHLNSIKDINN